eukprot:gene5371-5911_t
MVKSQNDISQLTETAEFKLESHLFGLSVPESRLVLLATQDETETDTHLAR